MKKNWELNLEQKIALYREPSSKVHQSTMYYALLIEQYGLKAVREAEKVLNKNHDYVAKKISRGYMLTHANELNIKNIDKLLENILLSDKKSIKRKQSGIFRNKR